MKIAMIHTPLVGRGGGERQILRLSVELQKLGHEVEIFTNAVDERKCYPDLLKNVTINVVPRSSVRVRAMGAIAENIITKIPGTPRVWPGAVELYTDFYASMRNIGKKIPKGFDVINNHNFITEWAAFSAKKRLKIPVVWMCNEPPFWFFHAEQKLGFRRVSWPLYEIFDRIAARYIDEIVVLSHIAEELVRRVYNRKSKIVRSGVDVDFFRNASGLAIRKKHNLKNDFVLLQIGAFRHQKRQIDSIIALFYLAKKYDNVKLILEGHGKQELFRSLSRKLGVEHKIIFSFVTDDRELAEIIAACDAFVFPSELTWGLAVLEAMASARPVIVSKKTGASEIIENNVNGIVVDHMKPREIARHVERLMNDKKLRKNLGQNAYEYVTKNLSWEKYAENMEIIFRQTVSNFKGS